MALAPDKKRLLVSLGALGLLLLLTQVIGYQLSVGNRLKATKKVRVLSSAGQGGGASPTTVLLDLRAVPDINITNFQLTFGLLESSPAARTFLHLCSFNKLPGKLMGLSSSRHGTAQMVLGDQFPNSNGGSSVPHDGPWLLAINGGQVETGSDEHGWQKLGLMRSGSLEALRYLVKQGGNGHLAVQDCQTMFSQNQ